MKNTLGDLNNYLFEQMERLMDDTLTPDALESELARSKAVTSVAATVIENSRLALEAMKHVDEYGLRLEKDFRLPAMLEAGK